MHWLTGGKDLSTYLYIVQLLVAIVLIVVVLIQSKGAGFNGTFSNDSSVFRTRRGVEKTLFNFTLVLAVVFVVLAITSVAVTKAG